jgi:4-aminobutyrate aminotransferase/(S)-3-amino-2-methylpropionate transaminase
MQRRNAAIPRGPYHMTPIFIARGEGALIADVDGNILLDFAGGLGCLNVGHCAPAVVAAVREQAEQSTHACFHVTPNDGYVRLAEALNARTPGKFAKKTLLLNSGAEAVENAVKIARAFTKRQAVICFEDAFHGRTLLTMSLTSKTHPYKIGFGPFAPEVYRIPYAYCYRCSYSKTYPSCDVYCARELEHVFKRVVEADSVAAVLAEPVLGEGGFVLPPKDFFAVLQRICREHGILFIADEVQTGYGRTGTLFACEQLGIEPDLLTAGKSMAGGLPMGSVTGRAEIMDAPVVGGLGGTFGGNPIACAAALAVLATYDQQDLSAHSQRIGTIFEEVTRGWPDRYSLVGDIRGIGAMRAIEFVTDRQTRTPAKQQTDAMARACYERGLVVLTAGTLGNVIRLLVPLVATDEQIREGLSVLETAIASVVPARSESVATR